MHVVWCSGTEAAGLEAHRGGACLPYRLRQFEAFDETNSWELQHQLQRIFANRHAIFLQMGSHTSVLARLG